MKINEMPGRDMWEEIEWSRDGEIESDVMLADWGRVAQAVGRAPARAEYEAKGKFSVRAVEGRFGEWPRIPGAFVEFAGGKKEWEGVLRSVTRAAGCVPPVAGKPLKRLRRLVREVHPAEAGC